MIRIALLSNPRSTGNRSLLPRVRSFCAYHPEIFHYEVEHVEQIGTALDTISRVEPTVLVINGGDGTVQATLTELYHGGHFNCAPPPVAVLPNGKTNLIALDLGATGDPIEALERVLEIARGDLSEHIVTRELIALTHEVNGVGDGLKPVLGMFLGGAGLTEVMLYCRNKIYPLGLPNSFAHVITAIALLAKMVLRVKSNFLPPDPQPLNVSLREEGDMISGRFSLLAVTTLEKLLLSGELGGRREGVLKLLAIEQQPMSLVRGFAASLLGKLGRSKVRGVHFEEANEITIEGDSSDVILDGETFRAEVGSPINLKPAAPLSFVKLAA